MFRRVRLPVANRWRCALCVALCAAFRSSRSSLAQQQPHTICAIPQLLPVRVVPSPAPQVRSVTETRRIAARPQRRRCKHRRQKQGEDDRLRASPPWFPNVTRGWARRIHAPSLPRARGRMNPSHIRSSGDAVPTTYRRLKHQIDSGFVPAGRQAAPWGRGSIAQGV